MSSCDNFVEQLWRKGKCANCFQSRDKHQNVDKTHEDTSFAGSATANCRPKRVVILPQSQRNQNVKPSNVEKTANLFKQEQGKEGIDQGNGVNGIKTIAPCTTHAIKSTKDRSSVTDASNKVQDSKLSVAPKPKPAPRPKPRPSFRAVEFSCSAISRDENPQESADVLNGPKPLEESLGNSHAPRCNANSLGISEEPELSILDHDKESEQENKLNIETVCETAVNEIDAVNLEEPRNDAELSDVNESDNVSSSNNTVVDSLETETDASLCKTVDEEDDSSDEYVPMKSNVELFGIESENHKLHETDVLKPNCEITSDLQEMAIGENRMKVTCDPRIDEENSSTVLEFHNPLCIITNEISDSNTTDGETGDCDKVNDRDNPNKIISKSSNTTEPYYVNRPASSSSESTVSSSQDSGYENTRKSTRSDSSNSASGNNTSDSVHVKEEVGLVDIPVSITATASDGCCNIESSGTSSSSWGSSTWDSCSTSDFHENSSEAIPMKNTVGNFNTINDKPHSEVLPKLAANGQSIAIDKLQTSNSGHVYVNTTLKPFTKPYKVVDISTGVSVPTMESQNDAPPLPPKEKDLKKDRAEELNHVYLEPSEETVGTPEQGPKNKREDTPVSKAGASLSASLSKASSIVMDKSPAVRRAPAPRPRSRIPSQFGTLPKPAPRTSRILNDTVVKMDSKDPKVATATPPVGKFCDLT